MKIVCARKDLYEGVQTAARAVSTRTSLPILGHLLIKTEEDRLRIAATDLEIGMECVVPATVQEQGSMTALARVLVEVLGALPETDVALTVDESHTVVLNCGTSEYSILGLPPEEFPILPEVREEVSAKVDRDVLRNAIRKTSFAISPDESRAILTGVLMQVTDAGLKLVSTDSHRLCLHDCPLIESQGAVNAIVPGRALNELTRIVPEGEGQIAICVSSSQIKFQVEDTILVSRLIDGQFPNYEKVVPTSFTRKLTIPTDQFLQSVRRVAIVARENSNRMVMQTEDGKLIVTAESGNVGKAHEEVEVIKEGDELKMAFNARYLLDFLSVVETEAVDMELTGEVSQALMKPTGQEDYLYVLMPMQVN